MRMIIVLDKVCLAGVIAISFYAGYKAGELANDIKLAKEVFNQTKPDLHEVTKGKDDES